jgi:hypothetical protein
VNTRDIFTMILNEFVTTGECYGDICKYCKYKVHCDMISTALLMVLGGAYHG